MMVSWIVPKIQLRVFSISLDGNLRVVDVGYVTQDGELIYYENESIQTIFPCNDLLEVCN